MSRHPRELRRLQEEVHLFRCLRRRNPQRAQLGDQELWRQKIPVEETRQALADPVLVGRQDRRVRDRQAQRVAEQCGHCEPVGQAADQRRQSAIAISSAVVDRRYSNYFVTVPLRAARLPPPTVMNR